MKRIRFCKRGSTMSLWSQFVLIGCGFILLILPLCVDVTTSFAQAQLSTADCVKCHAAVVETVEGKGAKHKSAISCMDCHKGHPPMVSKDKIIPACSMCHAGKAHYEIGGCNTCHSDPHAPLDMKLGANVTGPCLSCHPQQGQEVKDHPTLHSKLFCTTCHREHKQVPPCLQCHRSHSSDMVNKDCLTCHPAHQPLTINYGPDMPSKFCAACHQNISTMLLGTDSKHAKLVCVFCHKEKHKMVPACESCHGSPHPSAMLTKFKTCNACHINAHTLGKEVKKK
ncbi:MAG: cytochrome C [Nitrospirota bacterium]